MSCTGILLRYLPCLLCPYLHLQGLRQQQDSQEQQIQEQLQQLDSQEQQMQEQLQQLANKDARILSLEQQLRVLTQQHLTELQQERKQHEAHTEKLRNDILENEELVCEFQATLDRLHDQLHQREHNLWKTQQELRCQKKELERRDEQLMEKIEQLREKEETITNLLQQQSQRSMSSPIHPTSTPPPGFTFAYKITSRGLENATTNVAVELTIEVVDAYCRPYASDREITAEIKSQVDGSIMSAKVVKVTPCQYKVIYKPQTRGFCDLHIMADNADIHGSPFKVFVHHPPSLLSCPVRVIENIALPWGISLNSHGDILVTENGADRVLVIDGHGKTVRTIGCGLLKCPTGIAVDDSDHVYVASEHCLLKFSQLGEVVNTVGMRGNKYGEFDCPMGISIHQEQLYVCDWLNERVQVFDLNLRFLKCFSITGAGSKITDLAFDSMGKIYTIDHRNNRVYVLDPDTFQYEPDFGQYGEELKDPTGIHIADYVYVSDCSNHRVVVYSLSGEFIACFGGEGTAPGLLSQPRCITTDPNGFVYVCDFGNGRIQVF